VDTGCQRIVHGGQVNGHNFEPLGAELGELERLRDERAPRNADAVTDPLLQASIG
jgi:hypothetical protein